MLQPKRFAGLFGAAPAVAIAGLAIVLLGKPAHDARENSIGMLAGCVGMFCYALSTTRLLHSGHSLRGAVGGLIAWIVPTTGVAILFL
jgi:Protein of unknown function (DUF3147)